MQHVIQEQTIEVTTGDIEDAKALQQRIELLCKTELLELMDELLSSFSERDIIFRLGKLELDLGVLPADDFERRFQEQLRKQLASSLQREISQLARADDVGRVRGYVSSRRVSDRETLLYFLQHGVLPWWVAGAGSVDPQDIMEKVLGEEAGRFIDALRDIFSFRTVERFVKQFSTHTYASIVKEALSGFESSITTTSEQWLQIIETAPVGKKYVRELQSHLLWFLLQISVNAPAIGEVSDYLYDKVFEQTDLGDVEFVSFARMGQRSISKGSGLFLWLEEKLKAVASGNEGLTSGRQTVYSAAGNHKPVAKQHPVPESDEQVRRDNKTRSFFEDDELFDGATDRKDKTSSPPTVSGAPAPDTVGGEQLFPEKAYYLENAGLILLWPFLTRYFYNLNLTRDDCFVDTEAREKAVALLQYLAFGYENVSEHLLLLNKILCGWPPELPLLKRIEFSGEEKREADELLSSIILHWTALKKSSIDGLRQSFLQREGRLKQVAEHWDLKVARRGIDVLLDKLPWGISTVRLPWMTQVLYVEW